MSNKDIFSLMPKPSEEAIKQKKEMRKQKVLKLLELLAKSSVHTKEQSILLRELFGFEDWVQRNQLDLLCAKVIRSDKYYFSGRGPEEEGTMDFEEIVQSLLTPSELIELLQKYLKAEY